MLTYGFRKDQTMRLNLETLDSIKRHNQAGAVLCTRKDSNGIQQLVILRCLN